MPEFSGKYRDHADEELLRLYSDSGDLDVLAALYERYMHLVFGVALKYLQDREEARDAVMQIFERLITELPRHQVRTFQSWLYVLTRNHCLMILRSKKQEEKKLEGLKIEYDFMESGEDLHPIDRDDPSMEEALRECLEQLKHEQKKCIELFYYQQRSYQEISKALQIDENKVKSYLQNGKRNLKICLERKNVR
ncbi:MAG: RNA polymerase sigma factor [Bacteroidales bacterium]